MSEGFLLDTNICIYAMRGHPPALRQQMAVQREGSLFLSSISLAEIAVGLGKDSLDTDRLQKLLDVVIPLPFDSRAAMIFGTLPFRRSRFDRLIAAHALALDLTLITNNEADFADIPGLRIENWTL